MGLCFLAYVGVKVSEWMAVAYVRVRVCVCVWVGVGVRRSVCVSACANACVRTNLPAYLCV